MFAIPFGVVGAVIGHILLGFDLSLISFMGVIALSGVVVNDALIMIAFANRKRGEMSAFEAIHVAGIRRFRPIILTTLTTAGGLTPIILETSRQAAYLIPMAISLGFGSSWSTPIRSSVGELVGVFAVFYREERAPVRKSFELFDRMTRLAGIAIERNADVRPFFDHPCLDRLERGRADPVVDIEPVGLAPDGEHVGPAQRLLGRLAEREVRPLAVDPPGFLPRHGIIGSDRSPGIP